MAAFEDAVLTHGAELRTVRDEVGTRTIYEVVRYYGHWKKYISIAASFPAIDCNPQKTARNSRKRTAGGFFLAPRKYHHRPQVPYTPQTTRIQKARSFARRAKHTLRVAHAELVTPSYGGKHQRACQRPCCAMLAASRGASTQISTISDLYAKRRPRSSRARQKRGRALRSRRRILSA